MAQTLITGRVLAFEGVPFDGPPENAARWHEALLVQDGRIAALGREHAMEWSDVPRVDYGQHVICAGFVDAHVHYPQTAIIASWGKRRLA